MTDEKTNKGAHDHARFSAEQPYEVECFAQKHRITLEKAREIIQKHGPSRSACDAAVTFGG